MIQVNWVWLGLPVAIVIAALWLISRFQVRLLRSRGLRELEGVMTSVMTREVPISQGPVPDHVVELIRQGRREEAIKAMRELAARAGADGGGDVKTWTSDDGTVHTEVRSVTYKLGDLPDDVLAAISAGDMSRAIKDLKGAKSEQPGLPPRPMPPVPTPKKRAEPAEPRIPSKDEINDPKPTPFALDD